MTAYYNEFDKNAAAWLRELIKMNLIAHGEVDDRSILDVEPSDLRAFKQHHFFAGIGGWSYSLRLARWPDNHPVCTASLPCQPFSSAGKRRGKQDERHLLPHFIELVKRCDFPVIFGEQVPAAIRHGWLDGLYDEMERENYAVGACVLTAAGEGAPHIRQRLYWVANTINDGDKQTLGSFYDEKNSEQTGYRKNIVSSGESRGTSSDVRGMGDTYGNGREARRETAKIARHRNPINSTSWDDIEWLYCRDGKYRPVKSGIKPLVNGFSKGMVRSSDISEPINADETQEARVMRLKGYGNAIIPQVAAGFIKTYMDITK
jgi:DNA (cytosine-5)-methyltransferase 1